MDFVWEESLWPWAKNAEQIPTLKSHIQKFLCDQSNAIDYLEAIIENTKIQSKSLLFDSLLIICQSKITGVRSQDVEQLKNLLQAIAELIWYLSRIQKKLKNRGTSLPTFFNPIIKFNDPLRHKHKVKQIQHAVLLNLNSNVTTILERTFFTRKSFKFLHDVFDKLVESAVKYTDYLQNLTCVKN